MSDLISRQDVLAYPIRADHYDREHGNKHFIAGIESVMEYVECLPSAEQEIIRCKDCKHWMPYDWMFSEVWQSKNMEDYPEDEIGCDCCDMNMRANDYCSRAERRGEEE